MWQSQLIALTVRRRLMTRLWLALLLCFLTSCSEHEAQRYKGTSLHGFEASGFQPEGTKSFATASLTP